ncbi:hypothetical protein H5410_052150 [Solanum commersonii]|uniref:Uncharacterized protein n=1 Tax=Solanum commersonii TaxID=4109 RepID=A0A9J5X0D1_SOLCO|nr:hypothetical protein H5410_052150 [Solanum commersonii]
MTKVGTAVSSIPWIIVTRHDLCNDDIPSDSLLPSGTCIDVVLDVTVDNTTLNKGDVPNEGKVSDVTLSKLQIQRKIMHMCPIRTTGATTGIVERYYTEPITGDKFR